MSKEFDMQGMRSILKIFVTLWVLGSFLPVAAQENGPGKDLVFGEDFENKQVISGAGIGQRYAGLQPGDSLSVRFQGKVSTVCKQKGCWMTLDLEEDGEVMVRFKDYGFFMPREIEGRTVVINGKAFTSEMSVEEQRHYARDEGLPEKEITSINTPKRTRSFIAHGVKIKPEH